MKIRQDSRRSILTIVMALAVVGALAVPALAGNPSLVTRGDFSTFASGEGLYDVGGHATMVRTVKRTKVTIHVTGLNPDETYVSHVHKQACGDGYAGGHFQQGPSDDPSPPNEIWPGNGEFTPNPAGIANQKATVPYFADSDAVSVVVHAKTASPAPKIACADLG